MLKDNPKYIILATFWAKNRIELSLVSINANACYRGIN